MGYRLKRLDEPIFMAGPKPMRTDFGIYQRLESCVWLNDQNHQALIAGLEIRPRVGK